MAAIKLSQLYGGGSFVPSTLGTSAKYVLSSETSPLVLTPPAGKIIRLDYLGLGNNLSLDNTYISVGDSEVVRGNLRVFGSVSNGAFQIGRSGFGSSSGEFAHPVGYKEPIIAFEEDQSISISTTDTTAQTVHYSVTYGNFN